MKYCGNCGKEINPGQAICLNCGFATSDFKLTNEVKTPPKSDNAKTLGTISIIFGVLGFYPAVFVGSIIGIVTGIIGMNEKDSAYRGRAKAGFWISIISLLFWLLMVIFLIALIIRVTYGETSA